MEPRTQNDSENGVNITRSMTTHRRNSLTLPADVVTEIFSRLPLKSIARCRCACKLWSSMLLRQDFTDLFLTKSCARPQLLVACEDDNELTFLDVKKVDSEFLFFSSPQPQNPDDNSYVVAVNNLACFPSSYKLLGCTNGFLCYGDDLILKGQRKSVNVTVICNPSTGQSLTLPSLNSKEKYGVDSYLGYDPIAKEFKVLSVRYGCDSKEQHVMTLGTEKLSWRLVECSIPHCSSRKWICIGGVLYYTATTPVDDYMVVCFDLRTEEFIFVKFSRALPRSTTLINYKGRLGLLMSEDSGYVSRSSKSIELWVLQDAAKHEWSNHVYMLPTFWTDVVAESMCIAGMVGVNEIVLSPCYQYVPSYVIYFNVESKSIRKVGIQGMEAFQGNRCYTYLNYVENVKLL